MSDKKDDHSRQDSNGKPPKSKPTFDEKPRPLQEERIRKNDPMISDTYKPPTRPPKKG
jgi:hypothetical protein